jgi:hypothetical protein
MRLLVENLFIIDNDVFHEAENRIADIGEP